MYAELDTQFFCAGQRYKSVVPFTVFQVPALFFTVPNSLDTVNPFTLFMFAEPTRNVDTDEPVERLEENAVTMHLACHVAALALSVVESVYAVPVAYTFFVRPLPRRNP